MASASRLYSDHHVLSTDPVLINFDLQSLTGQYTPVDDFFVRNHYGLPQASKDSVLQIDGDVKNPQKLRMEDLAHLPQHQVGAVLECAGNGTGPDALVSNGFWEGWSLADVLSLAAPSPAGAYLHITGHDGFIRSIPLERAQTAGLLVTHLNHQPITSRHGAPWRVLLLGNFGMDSVKWVERITVSLTPLKPADNSYLRVVRDVSGKTTVSSLPTIQIKSALVSPPVGAVLKCGPVEVRGVAWTGEGKVSVVELTADKGRSWLPAKLGVGNQREWVEWQATLELLQPGLVELGCRATDDEGNQQPMTRDSRRLDGYADNTVEFVRFLLVK